MARRGAIIAVALAAWFYAMNRASKNIAEDFTDWSSDVRTFGFAGLLGSRDGGQMARAGGWANDARRLFGTSNTHDIAHRKEAL